MAPLAAPSPQNHPLNATDISPQLKSFLPLKLSSFLLENQKRVNEENGKYVSLREMFPIEGLKTEMIQVTKQVPVQQQPSEDDKQSAEASQQQQQQPMKTETVSVESIKPPSFIPHDLRQFWIGYLPYREVVNKAESFQRALASQQQPHIFPLISKFAHELYEKNYFMHSYFFLLLFVLNFQLHQNLALTYDAKWGLLTSHLLVYLDMKFKNQAPEHPLFIWDINALVTLLDSNPDYLSPFKIVEHRAWLMHYALVFYFLWDLTAKSSIFNVCVGPVSSNEKGRKDDRDDREREKYMPAMQTKAPHLLPYLMAACVIAHRRRKYPMPSLLKALEAVQPSAGLADRPPMHPVVEFVHALNVNYDFEAAFKAIEDAKPVMEKDILLRSHVNTFVTNAKSMIAQKFLKVHSKVSVAEFAAKFGIEEGQVEQWLTEHVANPQRGRYHIADGVLNIRPFHHSVHRQALYKGEAISDEHDKVSQKISQQREDAE